jgi:hypothetical protein
LRYLTVPGDSPRRWSQHNQTKLELVKIRHRNGISPARVNHQTTESDRLTSFNTIPISSKERKAGTFNED